MWINNVFLFHKENLCVTYLNIVEYLGGRYSDAPLKSCDVLVAILNKDHNHVIGRGQYSEINTAVLSKMPVIGIYISGIKIQVFEIDDLQRIEGSRSWTEYANISLDSMLEAEIDLGILKDIIENL